MARTLSENLKKAIRDHLDAEITKDVYANLYGGEAVMASMTKAQMEKIQNQTIDFTAMTNLPYPVFGSDAKLHINPQDGGVGVGNINYITAKTFNGCQIDSGIKTTSKKEKKISIREKLQMELNIWLEGCYLEYPV